MDSMDSYVQQKRKENILKIDLDLEKAPPNYRNLINDLVKIHQEGYILLDILLNERYRIKNYRLCEDEDKFYNTIKRYKKFFYRVFSFEVTKLNNHLSKWVWGELEDNNLYNNHFSEIYSRHGKINFDFNIKNYLYIIFVYSVRITLTLKDGRWMRSIRWCRDGKFEHYWPLDII